MIFIGERMVNKIEGDTRVNGEYVLISEMNDDTAALLGEFGIEHYPELDLEVDGKVAEAWGKTGLYYTNPKALYDVIFKEYMSEDEEFSSSFCNRFVKMRKKNILRLYEWLARGINGDTVYYIPNATRNGDVVTGRVADFSNFPGADEIYEGDMKVFLESLNNGQLYRFDDCEENWEDDTVTGEDLGFIF